MASEKKVDKKILFQELSKRQNYEREDNIGWIVTKYGVTQSTAQTYYYQWKKWFMTHPTNKVSKQQVLCKQVEVQATNKEEIAADSKEKIESKAVAENATTESKVEKLKVLSMTVQGENGTYRVCEKGVELQNEGLVLAFENLEQLENFTNEYRQVFEIMK